MKLIFFLVLFSYHSVRLVAQDYRLADSLKQQLSVAEGNEERAKLLTSLCRVYVYSKPDTSIAYGLEAKQIARELRLEETEIIVTYFLSEALCLRGNFSKALEFDLESLVMAQKLKNAKLINSSLTSIAGVYFYSGDYQKALEYNRKVLKTDSNRIIYGLTGETFYHLKQFDSAYYYINKSYQLNTPDKPFQWTIPYYYMALIDTKRKNYEEALRNFRKGIEVAGNIKIDLVDGYIWMAQLFKQTGPRDSAISYAKAAIGLAQEQAFIPKLIDASSLLTELYLNENTDSAFLYQRMMLAAKDSLFSIEKMKQLQNLAFNDQLRQEEMKNEERQQRNKQRIYLLLFGSTLCLVVIFFLLKNNSNRRKAYLLLENQKKEVDVQKQKADQTLAELRATQSQLIQAEKMASLGELTAGIAHEIQNPLNFVNNFSEVSTELIEEAKGKRQEAKENSPDVSVLLEDIELNLEKISHHGKRADAIVKGMLQHSRTSAGQKEPTDINSMAEEYLRLAYHSFRGKELQDIGDNSFQVDLKTHLDRDISKVDIVPQDFGRVMLNLYSNAFYAVREKAKNSGAPYRPTVELSTGRENGSVRIMVRDNGNGIPEKIIDKIFQPFFTTKPTGEGTGLGLSLSYDIIKSNGGNISVKSVEGEGSEFVIELKR